MKTKKQSNLNLHFFLALLLASSPAVSQVRLPRLISNGMVIQRDVPVRIWGWASANEQVSVHFIDTTYAATAGTDGNWSVMMKPEKAGGPYEMQISSSNTLNLSDVMVGEVWVCSGQSNMELPIRRVLVKYADEIGQTDNTSIRQFLVPQTYDFKAPHADLQDGSWKPATHDNILDFSAVAFFFAQELYARFHIAVGLINSSLGGSPAESWMSESALKAFPAYEQEAIKYRNGRIIQETEESDNKRIEAWYAELRKKDEGLRKAQKPWSDPAVDVAAWPTMTIPGYWANSSLGPVNGVVWFRRDFEVPSSVAGRRAKLILGCIVNADSAYINGVFVGTTSYQYPPRRYEVPAGLLRAGTNTVVVRVVNSWGRGGFVPDKEYAVEASGVTMDLRGDWKYRLGASMNPLAGQTFIRWKPLGLYNAMLAPLVNYTIKGVIWYQGESNAERPKEYRTLFPAMIRDWRSAWGQGNFPFLFVQLPNFMETKQAPSPSNWALLREAQGMALSEPNTAMAVTIDIGEWNDIHPLDKKDVGIRLALCARKAAYGEKDLVASGPTYRSMKVIDGTVALTFSNIGGGLSTSGGQDPGSFEIAGADRHFVWANARLLGNEVVVWSDDVKQPVAVRYAWEDSPPKANLYNAEGLPAVPFRTDDWENQ